MNDQMKYDMLIQISKGLFYLHQSIQIPITHGNLNSISILLNIEQSGITVRLSEYGLTHHNKKDYYLNKELWRWTVYYYKF